MIQSEAQEVLTTSKLRPKRPAVHNLDLMIGGKAKAGLRDYGKVPMQQQVGQRRPRHMASVARATSTSDWLGKMEGRGCRPATCVEGSAGAARVPAPSPSRLAICAQQRESRQSRRVTDERPSELSNQVSARAWALRPSIFRSKIWTVSQSDAGAVR